MDDIFTAVDAIERTTGNCCAAREIAAEYSATGKG